MVLPDKRRGQVKLSKLRRATGEHAAKNQLEPCDGIQALRISHDFQTSSQTRLIVTPLLDRPINTSTVCSPVSQQAENAW